MRKIHSLCGLAAASFLAGSATAQYDVSISESTVQQALKVAPVDMIAGRSTIGYIKVAETGTLPPGAKVDAIMRLFVDGVESVDSPFYSNNGPFVPPAAPKNAQMADWLHFFFVAPDSGNVTVEFEVNPAGPNHVAETNANNNSSTVAGLSFVCQSIPEIVYVPIDYRPSGGGPNLPDPDLIEPGVGDGFIQGIFPTPDINYRPYDQPSKLWTSSVSGTGSSLNNAMTTELQMMNPKPDFIYSWIPGSLGYNGQAIINGVAAMGNTQAIRHQRTFAHELGHNFGMFHTSTKIATVGLDPENHLAITQGLAPEFNSAKNDIMVAGQLTNTAWVAASSFNVFATDSSIVCQSDLDLAATSSDAGLFIGGVYDHKAASISSMNVLSLPNLRSQHTVPVDQADLIFVINGYQAELGRVGILARTQDCSHNSAPLSHDAAFGFTLPLSIKASDVASIAILDQTGSPIKSLSRTLGAPQVEFTAPRPSELVPDLLRLEWLATDAEGDALVQHLRYSPDGNRTLIVASDVKGNSYGVDMTVLPRMVPGKGFFELVVSDGLNTTTTRTEVLRPTKLFATFVGGFPTTHILTPDNGRTFLKGATVLLHSSGWDLEDRSLDGTDIVWRSSVDGVFATGRMTSTASLSVGTHLIRVEATDSAGQVGRDSATITIIDRQLPGVAQTCQTDLGFTGPGTSVLSICGGDLSTGTTADLSLTGATASSPTWFVIGMVNNPTPILGGTLVPFPQIDIVASTTDATGSISIPGIVGGSGPSAVFVQAIYLDFAQVENVGMSNALQVNFLP